VGTVTTDDAAAQARTWTANNGGPVVILDWEANGGNLANLINVVDAFKTAGVTVQLGYYPHWYWRQQGGGILVELTIYLVSSGYPDGSGFASAIYANSGANTGTGWTAYGGATPAAWQFTNQALIVGHTVDCNAYQGTDLRILFGTTPTTRTPRPDAPVAL